ncbi:tetratricopeptide repeat protein [Armatimonas sp.]|uniref:tetratricopeptide repeat protein n=1 Tax=Armatimonas sp. TaxID=1872638 RepID=UPI00286CC8B8|nr:tetratricopeptide repeat protein [Armatimonas sp.]
MATPREIGVLRMKEGRFSDAAAALADAVALDASDVGAWRLLGGALAALEDTAGAVAAFQRAAALDPEQPKNHYNLALALQASGDRSGARQHFNHALVLDPSYAQATQRLEELEALPTVPPVVTPPSAPRVPPPPPPSYTSTTGSYAPPSTLDYGGGAHSAAAPGYGQAQRQQERPISALAPQVNGTNILVLGILGMTLTPVFSPFAWLHANRALEILDRHPEMDQRQRGNVQAGRILGVIGTILLLLTIAVLILIGLAGGFR